MLVHNGLVNRRKKRRYRTEGTELRYASSPNELWCADYKGEFMLADRRYCYPLTITDYKSRYLFVVEALETTKEFYAFSVFERIFEEFGLPKAIRTGNGVPFASPNAFFRLSKLSVWWLRLGIEIERIKPGHPEQNGRHERMHLTFKKETCKPAGAHFLQQQAKFDDFIDCYNNDRPHQAMNMRYPGEVCEPSKRTYCGLSEQEYPFHDKSKMVTTSGRICYRKKKVNLCVVFAGQKVGIKEVSNGIFMVSFMKYDLGYYDEETCRLKPAANPFAAKLLPMSPV
ncbi:transposase [Sneathiella sp. DP05]|uniref:Transposase n=2 Tax=Sneathiella litorea TaxID=2606216 RepID=A0A6L8WA24_9PROT|nr:transposase [Sneathiella litorea]